MKLKKENYPEFKSIVDVVSQNLRIRVTKYYFIINNHLFYSFSYKKVSKDTEKKFAEAFIEHLWRKLNELNKKKSLIYTLKTLPDSSISPNINILEIFSELPPLSKWENYTFPHEMTIKIDLIDRLEENSYYNCYLSDWLLMQN